MNGPAFLMPIADAKVTPDPYGQTGHSTEAGLPAPGRAIPREATAMEEKITPNFSRAGKKANLHPEDEIDEKSLARPLCL